jgi:hypothetical protein
VVGHERDGLGQRQLEALEGLIGGDDLAHPRIDALQVVVGERRAGRKLEVVVEAVLDRRAARRTWPPATVEHGLCQHVRRRVSEVLERLGVAIGDETNLGAVRQRLRQVDRPVVRNRDQRCLRETRPDRGRKLTSSRAVAQCAFGTVRKPDRDL